MRIQCSHGDPPPLNAPSMKLAIGKPNRFLNPLLTHQTNCLSQRDMSGEKHDAKILSNEAHRVLFSASQRSQEICMAGKAVPAEKQCALVNRRGRDGIDFSGGTEMNGSFDVTAGGFPGGA